MNYSIGLDIGISSVGWAVINLDKNRIEDLNSRMFDVAENPKNGSSLATPRREARSARRTIRRRRYRVKRVRKLIVEKGLLSAVQVDQLHTWKEEDMDIWLIRVNGLERKLSDREFARIMVHYAKNRGFKSNRKSDAKEDETGALLTAVKENAAIMEEKQYRTVAEMLVLDDRFKGKKRNKGGDYSHTLARSDIEKEIRIVFEKQREFSHPFANAENEEAYIKIWRSQRPFSTQEDITKKIGNCTFEVNEKRAPKFSYTFERFRALDKMNRLRILSDKNPQRMLTSQEREAVLKYLLNKKEVKYKELRKVLQLSDNERFNELFYDAGEKNEKNENKTFLSLKGYYQLRKVVKETEGKNAAESYRPIDYDTFAYAVTVYKDDNDMRDYLINDYVSENGKRINNLANRSYSTELIEGLLNLSFSSFGHLSLKALTNINPYLEEGYLYHEACEKAGYNFNTKVNTEKQKLLPVIPSEDIVNPVVVRSLSQTRKIINGIIKRFGSPSAIYIELAREMGRHYTERKEIEKQYNNNRNINKKAKDRIRELHPEFSDPRGHDILKYKLWEQQNGRCAYSIEPVKMDRLFESGYAEVDHIIPYSRSFDDSNANKVLVLSAQNQNKENKTPFEWFGSDTVRWEKYTSYVSNLKVRKKKKDLLLKKNYDEEQAEQFKSRHLNDTRYITRFLKNFIEDNLQFREEEGRKQYVYTVNGAYTSLMRKRWGFNKNREESDLHHAMDAAIVAVSLPFRHRVSNYFKRSEEHASQLLKREGERFPEPWYGFRRELEARFIQDPDKLKLGLESLSLDSYDDEFINRVKPVFVSRMPKRSVKGQIHEETIRRHRGFNEKGYTQVVTKTPLENINFNKKTGDFPMYGKESDPKTYQAIKTRYLENDKNVKKAFSTPLYKPSKKSLESPVVKSVKLIGKPRNQVVYLDEKTVADQASIVRTEVYQNKKTRKFYLAPVYVSDMVGKEKTLKLVVPKKSYLDWLDITDEYVYKFSLFSNDLIKIKLPKEKETKTKLGQKIKWKEDFFYYKGFDIASAVINITNHMDSYGDRIGTQRLNVFEKYQVNPLGDVQKVHKEKSYGV